MGMNELVVIGAGLPRTGTLSLRSALELLLGGPCYHGATPLVEQPDHRAAWLAAFRQAGLEAVVKSGVLAGYRAGLDHPFMCWWRELSQARPDARVILTVRDPARWAASFAHINRIGRSLTAPPYSCFLTLVGLGDVVRYLQSNNRDQTGLAGRLNRAYEGGEGAAVEFYHKHVAEVRAAIPAERLLVFNVAEGWEPLCRFLDCPVPDVPFPRINDSQAVLSSYRTVVGLTWTALLSLTALALLLTTTWSAQHYTTLGLAILLTAILLLAVRIAILKVGENWAKQKST